jgi:hypothetical protein
LGPEDAPKKKVPAACVFGGGTKANLRLAGTTPDADQTAPDAVHGSGQYSISTSRLQ